VGKMEPAPPPSRPRSSVPGRVAIGIGIFVALGAAYLIGRGSEHRSSNVAASTESAPVSTPAAVATLNGRSEPDAAPPAAPSENAPGVDARSPAPDFGSRVAITSFDVRQESSGSWRSFGDVRNGSSFEESFVKIIIRCSDHGQRFQSYTFVSPIKIPARGTGTFDRTLAVSAPSRWTAEIEGREGTRVAAGSSIASEQQGPAGGTSRAGDRVAAVSASVPNAAADIASLPGQMPGDRNFGVRIDDFLVKPPDAIGSVWFAGDAHNTLPFPVKIRIEAKAYSPNGALLDSKSFYPEPMDIPAYGHATFNDYFDSRTGEVGRVECVPINR